MDYRFFLNDVQIEEPIGWADFELSMKRDDTYHGMQFLASTGSLRFWGVGAAYLQSQKEQFTISAEVIFRAESTCDAEFTEIIEGRLNFGKYKDSCGTFCIVEIPFEEDSCTVTFNNRFDNKINIDSLIATDTVTVLPNYTQLGQTISIPPKALKTEVDGSVSANGSEIIIEFVSPVALDTDIYVRPDYDIERYNNIKTGQLTGFNNCQEVGSEEDQGNTSCSGLGFISPQFLFEEEVQSCFSGHFQHDVRMKGTVSWDDNTRVSYIKFQLIRWDGNGSLFSNGEVVFENVILNTPTIGFQNLDFDVTSSGPIDIPDGIGFYNVLLIRANKFTSSPNHSITVDFDPETFFTLSTTKLCPASNTQYYMVHEALSRIVENITNGCIRVKSEYYGRTDSQPFSFPQDGCGGLRMITGGLKLRNAPNGQMFISAKDLISGLNGIDNIGFSITEDANFSGHSILQIEPIDFFYKDAQLLRLDAIADVSNELQESLHYAKINIGYKKWEVEQVNGLNEFNSNREYRTNVETISTTLDATSDLIAGSYPIELTRQQSFASSGAADTTYDNETFIICLTRGGAPFIVEENKVLSPTNIFEPTTIKNFRISPLRNLMRWTKSILNTYANISSSTSRIFFNSGTANFIASGQLDDATACRLENGTIAENQSIGITNFTDTVQATPLFKNEYASFEYPLSIGQWNTLKANPYGYIAYTCDNSATVQKGFIKEIKYRPAQGMADFTLRKKWGN